MATLPLLARQRRLSGWHLSARPEPGGCQDHGNKLAHCPHRPPPGQPSDTPPEHGADPRTTASRAAMRDEPLRGTCRVAMDGDSPPAKFSSMTRPRCGFGAPAAAFSPMSFAAPRRQPGQNLVPGSAVLTRQDRIGAVMFAGTRPSRGCAAGGRRTDRGKEELHANDGYGGVR
jgi:hypothetical protein